MGPGLAWLLQTKQRDASSHLSKATLINLHAQIIPETIKFASSFTSVDSATGLCVTDLRLRMMHHANHRALPRIWTDYTKWPSKHHARLYKSPSAVSSESAQCLASGSSEICNLWLVKILRGLCEEILDRRNIFGSSLQSLRGGVGEGVESFV